MYVSMIVANPMIYLSCLEATEHEQCMSYSTCMITYTSICLEMFSVYHYNWDLGYKWLSQ